MYLRKLIITVCAFVVLGGTTANMAQAKLKTCNGNMKAKIELHCGKNVLHTHATAARWIKNHKSRTLAAATWQMQQVWKSRLKFHLWMVRRAHKWITQAEGRLRPTYRLQGEIAHLSLWLCIHRGEGAWNDEGAPYYGGLQMTYGWDGLVGDAAQLTPHDQMLAAETGYTQNHYSVSWLEGQWPLTSPPCLQYA